MGYEVQVRKFETVLGDSWVLVRVVDGKFEASGFEDEEAARRWAIEQGHVVVTPEG